MALLIYQDDDGQQQVVQHEAAESILRDIALRRAVEVKTEGLYHLAREQFMQSLQVGVLLDAYNEWMTRKRKLALCVTRDEQGAWRQMTDAQEKAFQNWLKTQRRLRTKWAPQLGAATPEALCGGALGFAERFLVLAQATEDSLSSDVPGAAQATQERTT